MKFRISIAGSAALLMVPAAAASIEHLTVLPREDNACSQPKLNDAIIGNLSHLLGWQIAGAFAPFPNELAAGCGDISTLGNSKWGAIGFDTDSIEKPLCTVFNHDSGTDAKSQIANIIDFSTQIFITQLIGSFNEDARQYMCKNLDFYLIDYFMLTSADVIGAVCNSVGEPLPPRPFAPSHQTTGVDAAARAVKIAASNLYALLLASGATTSLELDALRESAPQYEDSLKAVFMNAAVIENALCSIKQPISVDEAVSQVFTWLTKIFITTIENCSDDPGWASWLCSNGGIEQMNCAGVNGIAANQQICAGATSG